MFDLVMGKFQPTSRRRFRKLQKPHENQTIVTERKLRITILKNVGIILLALSSLTTINWNLKPYYNASLLWMEMCVDSKSTESAITDNKSAADNMDTDDVPGCHTNPCLWNAGIHGSWVQDFDFAREYGQYTTPRVIPDGPHSQRTFGAHVASTDAPFPWRTSWKWVDYECSVDVMTYDNICHVLNRLNIRHLLFYGDSLTASHYHSFVNLMNSTNFDKTRGVLTCQVQGEETVPYTIRIFHERDTGGNAYPSSPRGVYQMENGTKKFIREANRDRMLGVFNIGAHYHNWTHYREDMDTMIRMLEEAHRTQDLLFFRATSPGHANCLPRNRNFDWKKGTRIRPLRHFSEYSIPSGHKFNWDKFEGYNNYTKHLLLQRKLMGFEPVMNFLDIYNMTVLRTDAHTAPADCLHFQAPGPVDWWNHLLYTYLKMMADHDDEAECRRSV